MSHVKSVGECDMYLVVLQELRLQLEDRKADDLLMVSKIMPKQIERLRSMLNAIGSISLTWEKRSESLDLKSEELSELQSHLQKTSEAQIAESILLQKQNQDLDSKRRAFKDQVEMDANAKTTGIQQQLEALTSQRVKFNQQQAAGEKVLKEAVLKTSEEERMKAAQTAAKLEKVMDMLSLSKGKTITETNKSMAASDRVMAAEKKAASAEERAIAAEARIETAEAKMTAAEAKATTADAKMTAAEAKATAAEARATAAEARATAAEARATAAEARATAAEAKATAAEAKATVAEAKMTPTLKALEAANMSTAEFKDRAIAAESDAAQSTKRLQLAEERIRNSVSSNTPSEPPTPGDGGPVAKRYRPDDGIYVRPTTWEELWKEVDSLMSTMVPRYRKATDPYLSKSILDQIFADWRGAFDNFQAYSQSIAISQRGEWRCLNQICSYGPEKAVALDKNERCLVCAGKHCLRVRKYRATTYFEIVPPTVVSFVGRPN